MLSKAKTKLINALLTKKFRQQHQLFRVEGSNNVLDFLYGGSEVMEVFASEAWIEQHQSETGSIRPEVVSADEMKKITSLTTPSEVLALFRLPEETKAPYQIHEHLTLMLDDIRDPGNLGTIIRTADWFGIRKVICSQATTDAFSPKVVQASMGSLARVDVRYADLFDVLQNLKADMPVYGALLEGAPLHEIHHSGQGVILIGSEAHGISTALLPFINHRITIAPGQALSSGKAESLNASIATAIICYELSKNSTGC
ncbi:MAG: RNA methyltransferase [Bacteroidales bacterium]|nr:RNA methyltransferase [Bacteroidales bacterium]